MCQSNHPKEIYESIVNNKLIKCLENKNTKRFYQGIIINPILILISQQNQNNCLISMLSPQQSVLSTHLLSLQKHSSSHYNPEKTYDSHKSIRDTATNIIKINQNSTKTEIIKQKNSVFVTDFKTPQNLIKFLYDKNLSYIGSDPRFFEITKDETLTAAACSGLMLPESTEVFSINDLEKSGLSLPLMIKPNPQVSQTRGRKYNSLITDNEEALRTTVSKMIEQFGGVTVEEYIEGRQLACLCYSLGTQIRTLSPVQFTFRQSGPQYITHQLQNDPIRDQWFQLCSDEQLSKQIKKTVESFFKIVRLSGGFLFNVRVNGSKIYLIGFEAVSFSLQTDEAHSSNKGTVLESILFHNGLTNKVFLQIMIESAKLRQQMRTPTFTIKFNKEKNVPVLYAAKAFEPGSEVYAQQNARQNIILVDWVKNHFDKISWGDFWSRNSHGWKPVGHSCSPNSQVLLNSVKAIKKINQGEEITVDFATLFYHQMTFECTCKSVSCRKVINLRQQKQLWFHEIPSSHFHPWMMDYMFKETLINILNDRHDVIRLEYSPGDCYAVAKKDLKKGQRVVPLDSLPIQNFNTRHSITKSQNQFFDVTSSYGQFMNHKCSNYNLIMNQDMTSMIATVQIPKGQMLTFNYLTTEWDICFPFQCGCGQSKCFGYVKGFKDMPKNVQDQVYNIGHCSRYIRQRYQQIS